MESLNRVLIFAAYVLIGCVIGIAAWAGALYYATSRPPARADAGEVGSDDVTASTSDVTSGPVPGVHIEHLFAQRAQIERLQAALAEKDALLERKTKLLDQKTDEQLALQRELDSAIDMLEMLAAEAFAQSGQSNDDENLLSTELDRIREERNKSAALAQRLQADLEEVKAELTATDEWIRQLQQQSELETTVLLADIRTFQSVASQALAGMGAESVPALLSLLEDPRPRVRRWSAQVLGQIGPPARDAIPALIDALRDPDPDVKQEVRRALESIQPTER